MLNIVCVKAMLYKQTRGTSGGMKTAGEGTEILIVDGICLYCVPQTFVIVGESLLVCARYCGLEPKPERIKALK